VKKQTGHKTWSQLMRYVNISADDVVEVLKELHASPEVNEPDAASQDASNVAAGSEHALAEADGNEAQDTLRHGANVVSVDFGARQRIDSVSVDPAPSMPSHSDDGSAQRRREPMHGLIGPSNPWPRRP
jgi:hypothetical protein